MSDAGITEDLTRSVEEITLGFIDDITPPAIAFALGEAVPAVTAKLADYMTKHDLKFIPADETIALIARQTPRPHLPAVVLHVQPVRRRSGAQRSAHPRGHPVREGCQQRERPAVRQRDVRKIR